MIDRTIVIEARDPLIFRDPRPAEASLPIRSLDWPLPSAVIGAIRTRLGRKIGYDAGTVKRLQRIEHIGPALAVRKGTGWALCFPAPADAILFSRNEGVDVCALRPAALGENEGTDLDPALSPLLGARKEKPLGGPPRFWTASATLAWLEGTLAETDTAKLGYGSFERQRRIHLEIEPSTFAAKEGQLFTTEGLEFAWKDPLWGERAALCSRIRTDDAGWAPLEPVAPLGGERRLAYWTEPAIPWPEPPESLRAVRRFRVQLIAVGAFNGGWKPGWLGEGFEGSPPGMPDLRLKLVAAAVPRAVAHSGWDLAKREQKATRFLAPAGSVYFFEVTGEQEVDVRPLWLTSICDRPQDRRDGFGVVLCGGW